MAKQRYPKSVWWAVDHDYREKLSPDEAAWLRDFDERYYGACFTSEGPTGEWSDAERRERYVGKNAANRDSYTHDLRSEAPFEDSVRTEEASSEQDWSPTPGYEETTEYKLLLAKYRAEPTEKLRRALARAAGRPPDED